MNILPYLKKDIEKIISQYNNKEIKITGVRESDFSPVLL